jgi:hypothetical protein
MYIIHTLYKYTSHQAMHYLKNAFPFVVSVFTKMIEQLACKKVCVHCRWGGGKGMGEGVRWGGKLLAIHGIDQRREGHPEHQAAAQFSQIPGAFYKVSM